VRIEPELLDALKKRAEEERRSLSAEVVWLLGRAVVASPASIVPTRRTMGMFAEAGFEDLDFEEFRRLRRQVSQRLMPRARRRKRVA